MRRVADILAITLLSIVAWSPTLAFAAWTVGEPIVTYTYPPSFTDSMAREAVAGGYNVVWVDGSSQQMALAEQYGLRAQASLYLDYLPAAGTLARTQLDATIDVCRNSPAAYSYFLTDEPNASKFAGLRDLVNYLRQRDPNHLAYINIMGAYNSNSEYGTNGFQAYLDQYVSTVQPSMLCNDLYTLRTFGDGQLWLENLGLISQKAKQAGIPFMIIVQACTWDPTVRVPNANELRYLIHSTLAYGAQGISYFNYSATGGGIQPAADGTPTSVYTALTPLNKEFKNIAAQYQLQSLKSIGGYLKGYRADAMPRGTTQLPSDSAFDISGVSNTMTFVDWAPLTGVLFGLFDKDGATAADATFALVQNLDYNASKTYTVTGPGNLSIFDATTGVWTPTGQNYATLNLAPGGGALVGLTSLIVSEPSTIMPLSMGLLGLLTYGTFRMRKGHRIPKPDVRCPGLLLAALLTLAVAAIGCGKQGPELAPVSGKVIYNGKPLTFGIVTFQPESGRASTGDIQPDGTFQMVTSGRGNGATVGKNKVRIACFTNQDPSKKGPGGSSLAGGIALGPPLIPQKYLSYETSGFEVEVRSGSNDPVVLELK